METFNIGPASEAVDDSSFIGQRCIELTMNNFGAAFPLTLDQNDMTKDSGEAGFKAFLFSIKSVKFQTQRGETGQAVMKGFSFQFISRCGGFF